MKFRELSWKYVTLIWTKLPFPGKAIKYCHLTSTEKFSQISSKLFPENYVKNHQTLVKFREKRSELMSRFFANGREILSYIKFKLLGLCPYEYELVQRLLTDIHDLSWKFMLFTMKMHGYTLMFMDFHGQIWLGKCRLMSQDVIMLQWAFNNQ